MKTFVFLSVFCVLALTQVPQRYRCRDGWESPKANCFKVYKFFENRMYFLDAEQSCRNVSAHLTSVHSAEENEFLRIMTRTGEYPKNPYDNNVWIGFSYNPNSNYWTWTDGSRVDYINWAEGEPNNGEVFGAIMPDI